MTERKTPWTPGPWELGRHPAMTSGFIVKPIMFGSRIRVLPECEGGHVVIEDEGVARLIAAAPTVAEKAEAVAEAASVALGAILTLYDPAIGLAAGAKPDSDTINMANEISEQLTLALSDLKAALAAAKGGAA